MEQEKQTQPEQKKKRLSTPLLIFIILMAVTLTLCAVVAGIWLHGRSSLRNQGAAPTDTPDDTQQLDSYTVLHDGKYYRYKDHMVNLLLIGVDSDNKPAAPLPYGSDNQADVILVAALDTDANRMTLISVSRDTMCDIAVLDQNGQVSGAAHTQLALSYSNGDGLYESCRLCQEAVSQLFYGLQFDGCAAFYMGGIGRLIMDSNTFTPVDWLFSACSSTAAPPFIWAASGGSTTPWAASPSVCWTTIPSPMFPTGGTCTRARM